VDLHVDRGRRVALVGPSGTGKTTIIEILLRFRDLDAGGYLAGGISVERLDPEAVRALIALAEEEAPLLDDSLAANLRLGDPAATDASLRAAMASVGLQSLLADLPDGLETRMGPRGRFVSGGERRRIALARALIADRPILIVDEPTAGLDPAAARAAVQTILRATADRGLLLVTHGTEGLEEVDEILVLGEGSVAERGTHTDLMAAGGVYAQLRSAP
jgi:ATP-binding cassette subfamily C protein CydCD